jgi:hypothetical protein
MSSFLYRLPCPRGEGERETGGLWPLPLCFSRRGERSNSGGEGERGGERRLIPSCLCLGGARSTDEDLLGPRCLCPGSREDERLFDRLRRCCLRLKEGGDKEGERPRMGGDLPRLPGEGDQLLDLEPSRAESRRATRRLVEGGGDTEGDRL